jgi:hypothetical protein
MVLNIDRLMQNDEVVDIAANMQKTETASASK